MKTSMTIERLEQVVRVLKELSPEKKFSLHYWILNSCACAIGHAASDSWFNRRGLRIVKNGYGYWPEYKRFGGFEAAKAFFGLDAADIEQLFNDYPARARSRRHVIARLNKYVRQLRKT